MLKSFHTQTHPDELPASKAEPVNILVVDDLPEKILVYRTILEELGQNLVAVNSGQEALKQVLKQEFAVILLDVNMPGMDGFETAALIRQRRKSAHTPIIFLTAFIDEMHAAQGYASGAVDYLPTPVVPEVLRAKVQVFIELSQMRRQAALQAEERALRTAAESAARRSDFLANAAEVFSKSHDRTDILRSLAQLPIPYLAEMSMVRMIHEESGEAQTEWAWKNSYIKNNSDGILQHPIIVHLEQAIGQAIKTGQSKLITSFPKVALVAQAAGKNDAELTPLASTLPQIGSAIITPITIRNQARGVILLARSQSQAAYQVRDMAIIGELASRAGAALENAILMDRIQEADRRKDEFLGMLAHELRNPLGPISNSVQLLRMLGGDNEKLDQLRDIIDRQVTHMSRMIDDLLDATRLARGKILLRTEKCNVTQLVRQTVEDYRSIFDASGLELEVRLPSQPIWLEGDPTRLVQIIGNLLHNAHKFTDPNGRVSVTLTVDEKASISIRDTGIGIDPQMLPYVFDVFRQAEQGLDRSRGGLGLGLALVKGLVALHRGDVYAKSNGHGQGAEFVIQLPVASAPAAAAEPPFSETPGKNKQYRILIIEDNKDTAESARLLLAAEGYEVETTYNGSDGLNVAQAFKPHVILCDIGLPGMDGYQVAQSIRRDALLSNIYVIALTGYGRDEDQLAARKAGFDLHMTKPIDYNLLKRALANFPTRLSVESA